MLYPICQMLNVFLVNLNLIFVFHLIFKFLLVLAVLWKLKDSAFNSDTHSVQT